MMARAVFAPFFTLQPERWCDRRAFDVRIGELGMINDVARIMPSSVPLLFRPISQVPVPAYAGRAR